MHLGIPGMALTLRTALPAAALAILAGKIVYPTPSSLVKPTEHYVV